MIRGLSYQKGVFFIGERHIACAFDKDGKIEEWVKPINGATFFKMVSHVFLSMPKLFLLFTIVYFSLIFLPKLFGLDWNGLPYYFIFYYMFGTHFIFPMQLRKYHGAEHKVFSYAGIKSIGAISRIKKAEITNRNCSTNAVVCYFSSVVFLTIILLIVVEASTAIQWASYGALPLGITINKLINLKGFGWLKSYVLSVSYYLQRHITTAEPDLLHVKTAIRSYRCLARVEFPERLRYPIKKREEKKKVAIVDVTIIPIGTKTASVSDYVADIHRVLKTYEDKVSYKLTPMSTIIEGELSVLFEVIQAIHEVPFKAGIDRVATNIRIDDRRDKHVKMEDKLASVENKLNEEKNKDQ